eukprot:Selendium_serpulae@DN6453_c1_g1_i6.p1
MHFGLGSEEFFQMNCYRNNCQMKDMEDWQPSCGQPLAAKLYAWMKDSWVKCDTVPLPLATTVPLMSPAKTLKSADALEAMSSNRSSLTHPGLPVSPVAGNRCRAPRCEERSEVLSTPQSRQLPPREGHVSASWIKEGEASRSQFSNNHFLLRDNASKGLEWPRQSRGTGARASSCAPMQRDVMSNFTRPHLIPSNGLPPKPISSLHSIDEKKKIRKEASISISSFDKVDTTKQNSDQSVWLPTLPSILSSLGGRSKTASSENPTSGQHSADASTVVPSPADLSETYSTPQASKQPSPAESTENPAMLCPN